MKLNQIIPSLKLKKQEPEQVQRIVSFQEENNDSSQKQQNEQPSFRQKQVKSILKESIDITPSVNQAKLQPLKFQNPQTPAMIQPTPDSSEKLFEGLASRSNRRQMGIKMTSFNQISNNFPSMDITSKRRQSKIFSPQVNSPQQTKNSPQTNISKKAKPRRSASRTSLSSLDSDKLTTEKKPKKNKDEDTAKAYKQALSEFETPNKTNGRNLLHRACLELNKNLVENILQQYKETFLIVLKKQELITENKKIKDAAKKNNKKYIPITADEYFKQEDVIKTINQRVKERIKDYVDQQDIFQHTPFLLSCIQPIKEKVIIEKKKEYNERGEEIIRTLDEEEMDQNINDEEDINPRLEIFKLLEKEGANFETQNTITFWSAAHWCAHHCDYVCLEHLLKKHWPIFQYKAFQPDHQGFFPIDILGQRGLRDKRNHEIMFKCILLLLKNYLEALSNLRGLIENLITNQKQLNESDEYNKHCFIISPLQKLSFLFWSIFHHHKKSQKGNDLQKYIEELCQDTQAYVEAQIPSYYNMTPLIACCISGNEELLTFFLEQKLQKNDLTLKTLRLRAKQNEDKTYKYNFETNSIITFSQIKKKNHHHHKGQNHSHSENLIYKQSFYDKVEQLAIWENNYMNNELLRDTKKFNFYINSQDVYGNTALHYASIRGNRKCGQMLLDHNADCDINNKEGWRPRDFIQNIEIERMYQEYDLRQKSNKNIQPLIKQLELELQSEISVPKIENIDIASTEINELFEYSDQIFIPEFIIEFYIKSGTDGQTQNIKELNRINKNIQFIRADDFDTNLLKSIFQDKYFILVSSDNKKLERECKKLNMKMKLLDSYDCETYEIANKERFEPFRSKQRQEIIERSLMRFLNFNNLINSKIISQVFKMHTYGGITRLQKYWIYQNNILPVPLCYYKDYILTGQGFNFTSITFLKQYIGEKITFFFAWKSFLTCWMLFIGVPGIFLQFYIFGTQNWTSAFLPVWSFYVIIINTMTVEFWKRKSCEINYRWGQLDEMDQQLSEAQEIRNDFQGDECVSDVTGELTKYEDQWRKWKYSIISTPILMILIGCVLGTFLMVQLLSQEFKNDPILKFTPGIVQGVLIVLLNNTYTTLANQFTLLENHKYDSTYETNLILRQIIFKFLNSYFSIIYVAYIQDSMFGEDQVPEYQQCLNLYEIDYFSYRECIGNQKFYTLFTSLLPIVIIKQLNYMLLKIIKPWVIFRYLKERTYFKGVLDKYKQDISLFPQTDLNINENQDPIEKFWKKEAGSNMKACQRVVFKLNQNLRNDHKQNSSKKKNTQKYILSQIPTVEVDSIELNSQRDNFDNAQLIDYYAEGFIDLGFISLFAAAFPLGPIVQVFALCFEIKLKMLSFLFIFKRPTSQKCVGIGVYQRIWEFMTFASIFSNFGLLYLHHTEFFQYITGQRENIYDQEIPSVNKIWIFVAAILSVIAIRYFTQQIIPDKPVWIVEEEEKRAYLSKKENEIEETLVKKNKDQVNDFKLHAEKSIKTKRFEYQQQKKFELEVEILEAEQVENFKFQVPEAIKIQAQAKLDFQNYLKEKKIEKLEHTKQKQEKKKINYDDKFYKIYYKESISNIFSLSVLDILKNTFMQIETILLSKRMIFISNYLEQKIFVCNFCNKVNSIFECIECDDNYCKKCYEEYHFSNSNNSKKIEHRVRFIKQNFNIDKNQLKQIYNINTHEVLRNCQELILLEPIKQSVSKTQEKSVSKTQFNDNSKNWQKFENFNFPTKKLTIKYNFLQELFNYFLIEYISDNGIDIKNESIDEFKYLKMKKIGEKIYEKEDRYYQNMIIQHKSFNIEEKIYLNRIFFLFMKQLLKNQFFDEDKFSLFYQNVKYIQDGFFEQKLQLFLNLLDEENNNIITKKQFQGLFFISFIQEADSLQSISEFINRIYMTDKKTPIMFFNKSSLFRKIIKKITQQNDQNIKSLFQNILQKQIMEIKYNN